MFNGIIYKTGTVFKITKDKNFSEIILKTNLKFSKSDLGSSLCCNGTCLTITKIHKNFLSFYLSKETLKRTCFGITKIGDLVNIEKSLSYGNKIYKKFLIEKGSITVNGVSLTISLVKKNTFQINIIPHTLKLTNLIKLKKNNLVNIEFDIFGKYLLNLKN